MRWIFFLIVLASVSEAFAFPTSASQVSQYQSVALANYALGQAQYTGNMPYLACPGMTGTSCPDQMENIINANRGRIRDLLAQSLGVRSANRTCNISEDTTTDNRNVMLAAENAQTLENALARHSLYGANIDPNLVSRCLQNRTDLSEEEKKGFVSSYYYERNRIRQGGMATLEAIARFDALLGEKPRFYSTYDCKDDFIQGATEFCEAQAECRSSANSPAFVSQVERTARNLPAFQELQRRAILIKATETTDSGSFIPTEEYRQIQTRISIISEQLPWLKPGTPFMREYSLVASANSSLLTGNIMRALRTQIRSDREAMMNQWRKLRDAGRCIGLAPQVHGYDHCRDYRETVDALPDLVIPRNANEDASERIVRTEMETGRCLSDGRQIQNEGSTIINWFAADLAVTLGSFGAGTVIRGIQAAEAGAAVQRLGRVGNSVRKGAEFFSPDVRAVIQKGANFSRGAFELIDNSQIAMDIYQNCYRRAHQFSLRLPATTSIPTGQVCAEASLQNVGQEEAVNNQISDCLLSGALAGVTPSVEKVSDSLDLDENTRSQIYGIIDAARAGAPLEPSESSPNP